MLFRSGLILNRGLYFPRMAERLKIALSGCVPCLAKKNNLPRTIQGKGITISRQFQCWSIDFVGPLPQTKSGHKYLFTCLDMYSRWPEAFPVKDMTAATAVDCFKRFIFPRFCYPKAIRSDNAKAFVCDEFAELQRKLRIRLIRTPPYNPQSNPVERMHRDLGASLRTLGEGSQTRWHDDLPQALLALRIGVNTSLDLSPFNILFKQEPELRIDDCFRYPRGRDGKENGEKEESWADKWQKEQKRVNKKMEEKLQKTAFGALAEFAGKGVEERFKEKDQVFVFTIKPVNGKNHKLALHWTGPWTIVKAINPMVFRVKTGSWCNNQLEAVVSINRIAKVKPLEEDLAVAADLTIEDVQEPMDEDIQTNWDWLRRREEAAEAEESDWGPRIWIPVEEEILPEGMEPWWEEEDNPQPTRASTPIVELPEFGIRMERENETTSNEDKAGSGESGDQPGNARPEEMPLPESVLLQVYNGQNKYICHKEFSGLF